MGLREKIPRANKGERRLGHTDSKSLETYGEGRRNCGEEKSVRAVESLRAVC